MRRQVAMAVPMFLACCTTQVKEAGSGLGNVRATSFEFNRVEFKVGRPLADDLLVDVLSTWRACSAKVWRLCRIAQNLWANERKAMLTATSLSALLLAIAGAQQGGDAGRAASAQLSKELGESSSVSIYYVSRTGEYSYTREKIKEQSTLLIRRQCGGNCARLMEPVVLHLRGAVPSNCPIGQQTILIEIGDSSSVVYSHGGRSIRYQGKCYFSRTNIRQVIRKTEVIPP